MNQERAKQFMRDFDKVFEWLRETTGAEEINELKEYFANEYPELFQVECCLEEVNKELERITKHDKKIKDIKKALLTSISMEPFTNYEGIENDRTLSTVQKIILYPYRINVDKNVEIADFHGIATNSTFYMALLSSKAWILVKIMLSTFHG